MTKKSAQVTGTVGVSIPRRKLVTLDRSNDCNISNAPGLYKMTVGIPPSRAPTKVKSCTKYEQNPHHIAGYWVVRRLGFKHQ